MSFGPDGNLYVSGRYEVLRYASTPHAAFTASLSSPVGQPVWVEFTTADGTAVAGSDYAAVNGTLTFEPGANGLLAKITIQRR